MEGKINLYHYNVKYTLTEEQKDLIIKRILKFCEETNCIHGETLHQSDKCLIEAPSVLSDIIDNMINFEYL